MIPPELQPAPGLQAEHDARRTALVAALAFTRFRFEAARSRGDLAAQVRAMEEWDAAALELQRMGELPWRVAGRRRA